MMKKYVLTLCLALFVGILFAQKPSNEKHNICAKKVNETVQVSCKAGKVKIFDLQGKLRIKTKMKNIDLSHLPNGWYLVKTKEGSQVFQKVS